jgi:2,4-dienoyl-CoA reductase-like NADH-dependent reductase (Old Yellow Enzyme family)
LECAGHLVAKKTNKLIIQNLRSMEQVNGWKKVTETVHAVGGRIFLQIWHVGRSTDAGEFAKFYGGKQAVSSSTKPINGEVHLLRPKRKYPVKLINSIINLIGTI